jgi:pimeloyl-ACP methyl ester carboxylesterase
MSKTAVGSTNETRRLETAPTEFIEAAGITFAYRTLGRPNGTPLVLLQHFTGHMDSWDPAVVNGLAKDRFVVVFDNAGVGQSSGRTPDSVAQMAADAEHFMAALGVSTVDLLGFSLGGCVAQQLATTYPGRVRRTVLVARLLRAARSICSRSLMRRVLIQKRQIFDCRYFSRRLRQARRRAERS